MSLLRATLLVAVVGLALEGACVEARTLFPVDKASDRDGPCWSYKAEDDCLDNECSWCKTTLLGATCVPATIGRLMPLAVANCNNPPPEDTPSQQALAEDPKPKPQAISCGDNDNKADCLDLGAQEGDCAWCKGDFMPASCVGLKAAQWIPETVAKCKLPAKKQEGDATALLTKGHSKKRHDDDKKDKAPSKCMDNKEKHDCTHLGAEEGDCAWCAGSYMPGQCLPTMVAQWIPEIVASCKGPSKHHKKHQVAVEVEAAAGGGKDKPKPPTSCGDNKEKHDCLHLGSEEGECAWCAGDFMPASCVSVQAAKKIPGTVAECKMPKAHTTEEVAGKHGKGKDKKLAATCADNDAKKGCLRGSEEGECAWCDGGFLPKAQCMPAMAAKFLPEMVAKCKMSKKAQAVAVELPGADAEEVAGKHGKGKDKKLAATCADNDAKKGCLRGSEEGECAWCDGGFLPKAQCMPAMAAKFLPEMVAKCKMSKKAQAVAVELPGADEEEEQEEQEEQLAEGDEAPGDDPKPKPQAVSCGDNDNKADCLDLGAQEGDCAWCKGDFMPASCVGLKAAEWIPETVAKCKLPAKKQEGQVASS